MHRGLHRVLTIKMNYFYRNRDLKSNEFIGIILFWYLNRKERISFIYNLIFFSDTNLLKNNQTIKKFTSKSIGDEDLNSIKNPEFCSFYTWKRLRFPSVISVIKKVKIMLVFIIMCIIMIIMDGKNTYLKARRCQNDSPNRKDNNINNTRF